MSQDSKVSIRFCAQENCTNRMSSIDKDRHLLCPSHVGWQCSWETRCDVCRDWSDTQMRDYIRLNEGKARRKAYKDRIKAGKLAAGEQGAAHSLSPGSSSSIVGEIEPVSVPVNLKDCIIDSSSKLGDGKISVIDNVDNVNVVSQDLSNVHSASPRPCLGDLGQLGQGSVVPCGVYPLASKGSKDPAPLTVAGERPSHTGQPPQTLATPELGNVERTPSTNYDLSRYSGRQLLTPGAYNTLKRVLDEHEDATKEEKMHLMLSELMSFDSSFKGSLSRSRSCARSDRTKGSSRSGKSTGKPFQISVTRATSEITPRAGCSKESPNRVELTREWARMVQTGGVTVKEGTSCYYKDHEGMNRFVEPPTGSCSGGGDFGAEE